MISFPSIESFKSLISEVTNDARYVGKDELNKPIFNNVPLPTLEFIATTKIHGCNHTLFRNIK